MYKVSSLLLFFFSFDRYHIEVGHLHLPHINCQDFYEAFLDLCLQIHAEQDASAPLLCVDGSSAAIFRHTSTSRFVPEI